MQLKWNSTTTYPNIVKKTSAPKKISYIMHKKKHNYQPIFVVFLMFLVQYSVFQHTGLMHEQYQFCPWCYEDMSMVL
jgi:hypothetical protein